MIGLIDSGSGGLNVAIKCAELFCEEFIYLADNKNAPFGDLSVIDLEKIISNDIDFLLENYKLDLIILACNTASACVGKLMKEKYGIPILTVEPPVKDALKKEEGEVLVFATRATIENSKIIKYYKKNIRLKTLYIKNLAKMIDDNLNNLDNIDNILKKNLLKKKFCNIKTVVLGCTHFKLIKNNINKLLKNIKFYECEPATAIFAKTYINNNLKKSTIKLILTVNDDKLLENMKLIIFNSKNIEII